MEVLGMVVCIIRLVLSNLTTETCLLAIEIWYLLWLCRMQSYSRFGER